MMASQILSSRMKVLNFGSGGGGGGAWFKILGGLRGIQTFRWLLTDR